MAFCIARWGLLLTREGHGYASVHLLVVPAGHAHFSLVLVRKALRQSLGINPKRLCWSQIGPTSG